MKTMIPMRTAAIGSSIAFIVYGFYERLKPFMKEASLKAGETIFNKGDYADRLYMIIAGDIHLEQIDHILRVGDLFGEIGLFSADHQRIQAARTMTDVHLLWISERELAQSAIKILEWPSISCG
jgi:CRP-like cAMP-binding protein